MGVALDVEGKGDEDVANDGAQDADEGAPFLALSTVQWNGHHNVERRDTNRHDEREKGEKEEEGR